MEVKSLSPKVRQHQIDKEIGCSSSTSQQYRQDINMISPNRTRSNSHKRRQKFSNANFDVELRFERAHQKTSNDLKGLNSLNLSQMQTIPLTTQRERKANPKVGPCRKLLRLAMSSSMSFFIIITYKDWDSITVLQLFS